MQRAKLQLNFGEILDSIDDLHPNKDPLKLAFYSLEKRGKVAEIFLHEFDECLRDHKIPMERAGLRITDPGRIFDNRTYYEAYGFAMIQNMHAALDAFPFIVFMMLGPMGRSAIQTGKYISITPKSCAWSSSFLAAVEETFPSERSVLQLLTDFQQSKHFLILQNMVNRSKHQSLIRILNDGENVVFEDAEYFDKGKNGTIKIRDIHARNFMRDASNELFPALFAMVVALQEARVRLSK